MKKVFLPKLLFFCLMVSMVPVFSFQESKIEKLEHKFSSLSVVENSAEPFSYTKLSLVSEGKCLSFNSNSDSQTLQLADFVNLNQTANCGWRVELGKEKQLSVTKLSVRKIQASWDVKVVKSEKYIGIQAGVPLPVRKVAISASRENIKDFLPVSFLRVVVTSLESLHIQPKFSSRRELSIQRVDLRC